MKYKFFIILALISLYGNAQVTSDSLVTNSRYFEDQFYLGITYNFLFNKAPKDDLSQRKLSYGLQGGFIKDIPINADGTIALGIGLGAALNSYYSNLKAIEASNNITYTINADRIKRSKLETNLIEVPIQFRWRNSNAIDYKFWRVYAGIKFGYAVGARSKFVPTEDEEIPLEKISFTNNDIRKFQYGITLDFGYSSFNAHIHYSLTNLLNEDVRLSNNDRIQMQPLRIGLIFYIL